MGRTDFFAHFFYCIEVTDTGTGWFPGPAAVPAARVRAGAVPAVGAGAATGIVAAAELAGVAGAAPVPVTSFSPPSPLEHCIVLNRARYA